MTKLNGILTVIGHCCVDASMFIDGEVPAPSALQMIGPIQWSTGGCVPNVGGVANKLGMKTIMISQRGDDMLGIIMESLFKEFRGSEIILPISGESGTSFSIVLNRPGVDRSFLHYPGCNDSFSAEDILFPTFIARSDVIHFGYPTLMKKMYEKDGAQLEEVLRQCSARGAKTSLDLSMVNADSEAGSANWSLILKKALRYVNIFMPSLDEIIALVEDFKGMSASDPNTWRHIANIFHEWGAKIVVLKLGKLGLYGHSGNDAESFKSTGSSPCWGSEELLSLPFKENKRVSCTGSGDAAIAGFLAAYCQNLSFADCLKWANAVSSCSVESTSATGGIPSWDQISERLDAGWEPFDFPILNGKWWLSEFPGVYYRLR